MKGLFLRRPKRIDAATEILVDVKRGIVMGIRCLTARQPRCKRVFIKVRRKLFCLIPCQTVVVVVIFQGIHGVAAGMGIGARRRPVPVVL